MSTKEQKAASLAPTVADASGTQPQHSGSSSSQSAAHGAHGAHGAAGDDGDLQSVGDAGSGDEVDNTGSGTRTHGAGTSRRYHGPLGTSGTSVRYRRGIRIAKLTGTNYLTWKQMMTLALRSCGLLWTIEGPAKATETPNHAQARTDAVFEIANNIEDQSLLVYFGEHTTDPYAGWVSLRAKFVKVDSAHSRRSRAQQQHRARPGCDRGPACQRLDRRPCAFRAPL